MGARSENDDAVGGGYLNLAGSAYIFARSGDTWTQQTKLVPIDRSAGDEFGTMVSISGNTPS